MVEYLDLLKEDEEVVVEAVVGDHNLGAEEEKEEKPPIEVWDDPGEDLWAA